MIKLSIKNNHALRRNISCGILLAFFVNMVLAPISPAFAQGAGVPALGNFQPPVLLGLKIHPENPLLFDFIVDQGQSKLSTDELKSETTKLVKYFLAALTIPDKEVWVNLSPTEKDRIIPDVLGQTTMGKTMLEQDYVLKQLAASLTNPETDLGKKYWDQVNVHGICVGARCSVPLQTFNKVWIMPAKAEVLESNGIVLVGEKRLKVMLVEDLTPPNPLFKKEGESRNALATPSSDKKSTLLTFSLDKEGESGVTPSSNKENFLVTPSLDKEGEGGVLKSNLSSQIFRTTILPTIEKAVNEGKDFADVRQIYNSVILAAWYKKALKESLLGKIYTDKGKVAGVETDDKQMKQRIYEQYLAAFKKGAYNLVKEEADESGELIPRKYFSGGLKISASLTLERVDASPAMFQEKINRVVGSAAVVTIEVQDQRAQENSRRVEITERSFDVVDLIRDSEVLPVYDYDVGGATFFRQSFDSVKNPQDVLLQAESPKILILGGVLDEVRFFFNKYPHAQITVVNLSRRHLLDIAKAFRYQSSDAQVDLSLYYADAQNLLNYKKADGSSVFLANSFDLIAAAGFDETVVEDDVPKNFGNIKDIFHRIADTAIDLARQGGLILHMPIQEGFFSNNGVPVYYSAAVNNGSLEVISTRISDMGPRFYRKVQDNSGNSFAANNNLSSPVGGIDFDPTNMNLQIKRDGKGVPLPLPQQNLEEINIQGLFPVIINITPINAQTLPIFLGQAPKEPAKEPELAASTSS